MEYRSKFRSLNRQSNLVWDIKLFKVRLFYSNFSINLGSGKSGRDRLLLKVLTLNSTNVENNTDDSCGIPPEG